MNDKKQATQDSGENEPVNTDKKQQQQSDPQKTELKGFVDPSEDLEPTLEDGSKSPDK